MSFVYKNIDGVNKNKNIIYTTHRLDTSSIGINSTKIISGSQNENYWNSINLLFYTSGSPTLNNVIKGVDQFDLPHTNFTIQNGNNPQHVNKFHGYESSSILSIPQTYYGDGVRRGSFEFKDLNNTSGEGVNPIIKDDGYGNLYSTNARHSQSSATSLSSSDNYVGNIFYNQGIVVLTETSSWSGSVNYSELGTNFSVNFDSKNTVYTDEYTVTIKPIEFNHSMNYTLRDFTSGSGLTMPTDSASFIGEAYELQSEFTGSDFQPYITQVHLYDRNDLQIPVITAKLPKPVRVSNKISQKIILKIDK